MNLKATSLFMLVSLLVSGCAPGHVILRKADLDAIVQEQNEQLECLARKQENLQDTQHIIMDNNNDMLTRLMEISVKQDKQIQRQHEFRDLLREFGLHKKKNGENPESGRNHSASVTGDKQIIGAVEKVILSPPGTKLTARIDTGAVTSSLDARNIEHFERDGDRWVRFKMVDPEDETEFSLERKLVRKVLIIQATDEPERRPVVELGVTVGKHTQIAQFTLTDRRHMEYPVLIGRNILRDIMMVDVSESNIAPPTTSADSPEDKDKP